eukprot:CAMPEP_0174236728 /NCGR_PEP_ID=MMETSP0417-20130205/5770_1 /TAXON_ID=242541 /ORGANISM="Mayorella sp, Strain BSH-02190019" /LENGTH=228 /DNA_ID=CAMNT_0015315411 /DNA_START=96 /DNA_END=782 /DNA_ORIENTATION=+
MVVRFVCQTVASASLLVDNSCRWVRIRNGSLIYLSILKGTTAEDIPSVASRLVAAQAFGGEEGGKYSMAERGDVLIVPQACLGGKLRSKRMQYHGQIDKELGRTLYYQLIEEIRALLLAGGRHPLTLRSMQYSLESGAEGMQLPPLPCASSSSSSSSSTSTLCSISSAEPSSSSSSSSSSSGTSSSVESALSYEEIPADAMLLQFGTYGNRQALQLTSTGPLTHLIEL